MDRVARAALCAAALAFAPPVGAVEINQFPQAGPLKSTDIVPLYQGKTARTTLGDIAAYLGAQQGAGGVLDTSGLGTAAFASVGTGGAVVPLLSGANTWSGPQIYTGLTTGIGGHAVGTGDFNNSQQLTLANEDVTFSCTAACTATLPSAPNNGALMHVQDISGAGGLLTISAGAGATRLVTPAGPAASLQYTRPYQGAQFVYHATPDVWVVE